MCTVGMDEGRPTKGSDKGCFELARARVSCQDWVLAESKAGRGVGKLQLYPEHRLLACGEVVGRLTGSRAGM